MVTEFVDINEGVPQGTVIGVFLFSLMVNGIQPVDLLRNLLVKFADDMTISAPVRTSTVDLTVAEVNSAKLF